MKAYYTVTCVRYATPSEAESASLYHYRDKAITQDLTIDPARTDSVMLDRVARSILITTKSPEHALGDQFVMTFEKVTP